MTPENLPLFTPVRKGRMPILTAAQCNALHLEYQAGIKAVNAARLVLNSALRSRRTIAELALKTGVSHSTMRRIVKGIPYQRRCALDVMAEQHESADGV